MNTREKRRQEEEEARIRFLRSFRGFVGAITKENIFRYGDGKDV